MDELDFKTLTVISERKLHSHRAALEVIGGPSKGLRIEIEGRARIGTRKLADLALDDPRVSGLHCELVIGDSLRVRDLGSKNGTFLGPHRVFDAIINPGEELRLGDSRVRVRALGHGPEVPLLEEARFVGVLGRTPIMRALLLKLERLAAADSTVLIEGETGTGKERVAEALHLGGPRRDQPLVVVDCGSLPTNLIESELFGHEKGAFTGASARSVGAFERAHHGTIFLDEIGELPLELQPKLLRALESRKVRRVGGDRVMPVDVRVVAATNRDLAIEVAHGRFREDLYYRLAVVRIAIPPLRERMEDVPLLAYHLLREIGAEPMDHLSQELLERLSRHDWPGNVRELRNVLERAAMLRESPELDGSELAPSDLESHDVDLAQPLRVGKQRAIEEFERAYVTRMLADTAGNVSECARRAGMDRMSIYRIIQRLGLRPGRYE